MELNDDPPSSEVGSDASQKKTEDTEEKWERLLEQQNQNFLTLIHALKRLLTNEVIHLPEFDPDRANMDPRSWLSTASMCMADKPPNGAALMIALSGALKGQASVWLSQISYPGMEWKDFQDTFTTRFVCPEPAAVTLLQLLGNKPKKGECLASYAVTQVNVLLSQWNEMSVEQIAIATVLAHLAQIEPRANRLVFTSEIKTRVKLQQELKTLTYLKRKVPPNADGRTGDLDAKRCTLSNAFVKSIDSTKRGLPLIRCSRITVSKMVKLVMTPSPDVKPLCE